MPTYTIHLQAWASDPSSGGSKTWVNFSNAQTKDGSVSQAASNLSAGSYYLVGTNPTAFSPAVNEVLSSIDAVVTRDTSPAVADTVVDWHLYLLKAGVLQVLVDKANGGLAWPVAPGLADASYTWSTADLALLGLTLADCADIAFGVAFACISNDGGVVGGNVDAIVLTIHTTTAMGTDVPPLNIIPSYGVRFQ